MSFALDKDLALKVEKAGIKYDIGHGGNIVRVRVRDIQTDTLILDKSFSDTREDIAVTVTLTEALGIEKPKPLTEQVKEKDETIAALQAKLAEFTSKGKRGSKSPEAEPAST